jgi:nitroimidazol reductase NimA-like FMN-containing flavoprotein (pyridoxamine 5'-phosphate oxidase superfamily)
MRKTNQEIKDKTIIEDILSTSEICRIAMIDDGLPYLLPFNYGYRENCIYIHSALEGKKIDALKKNDKVCFEIEQFEGIVKHLKACKWSTTYRSIVGYGKVEIIRDLEEKTRCLEIIMTQHGATGKQEFEAGQVNHMVILKLSITSMTAKQSSNWNRRHTDKS